MDRFVEMFPANYSIITRCTSKRTRFEYIVDFYLSIVGFHWKLLIGYYWIWKWFSNCIFHMDITIIALLLLCTQITANIISNYTSILYVFIITWKHLKPQEMTVLLDAPTVSIEIDRGMSPYFAHSIEVMWFVWASTRIHL